MEARQVLPSCESCDVVFVCRQGVCLLLNNLFNQQQTRTLGTVLYLALFLAYNTHEPQISVVLNRGRFCRSDSTSVTVELS